MYLAKLFQLAILSKAYLSCICYSSLDWVLGIFYSRHPTDSKLLHSIVLHFTILETVLWLGKMTKLLFIFFFFFFLLDLLHRKECRKVLCHKCHIVTVLCHKCHIVTVLCHMMSHDGCGKTVHRPCSSCISSIENLMETLLSSVMTWQKQLSHYLYFFSFLFLLSWTYYTEGSVGKCHITSVTQSHDRKSQHHITWCHMMSHMIGMGK